MCALYLPPPPPPPACDSGCKAETNGFAGTQRGCQLKLPGVIWVYAPRSAAFFLLHYILFRRLSLFFSSLFFLFLLGNQLLVPTRPRVKCLVMIILHWLQIKFEKDFDALESQKETAASPLLLESNALKFVIRIFFKKRECVQETATNQSCCYKQMEADIWYPAVCERHWRTAKGQWRQICMNEGKSQTKQELADFCSLGLAF